jgi:hypothetical protein
MNEPITDLRRLERDAFRRFYEDGLFDVYLGLMTLVFFAGSVLWERFESEALSYVVMLAVGLAVTVPLLAWRRRLLRARLGTFKPGPARRVRITRTRWVLLGSVVLGLVAFAVTAVAIARPQSLDLIAILVPGLWLVNCVVVFGAMAYDLDVPRFYAYGLVAASLMPLMIWPEELWGVEIPAWLLFGAAGLALVVIGLSKLRRFLQQYPVPDQRHPSA